MPPLGMKKLTAARAAISMVRIRKSLIGFTIGFR